MECRWSQGCLGFHGPARQLQPSLSCLGPCQPLRRSCCPAWLEGWVGRRHLVKGVLLCLRWIPVMWAMSEWLWKEFLLRWPRGVHLQPPPWMVVVQMPRRALPRLCKVLR